MEALVMNYRFFVLPIFLIATSNFTTDAGAQAKKILGYDPAITLLVEADLQVVSSPTGRKTVYVHGFGANKYEAVKVKDRFGSIRLPGDVVTFDFADARYGHVDKSKSSLGQWHDMRVLLYVLNKLYESGQQEVGINAHSRGAATVVNTVAALSDQTGKYANRFSEIGIDSARQIDLLAMLRRGHIVLECPMVSVTSVLKHKITKMVKGSSFEKLICQPKVCAFLVFLADQLMPLVVRRYRPWQEQAIKSAENWNNAAIATIIHFQQNDEIVGNEQSMAFYEKLRSSNGDKYTELHVGHDGAHSSSFASFAGPRNLFLQKHGAAYKLPSDQ